MSNAIDNEELTKISFETIKKNSKSFSLAAKIFSEDTQEATVLLYQWCRLCDDAIDSGDKLTNRKKQLDRILNDISAIYNQNQPSSTLDAQAFQKLITLIKIPQHYPQELLAGMSMDLNSVSYKNLDELLHYCYRVAGVVGLMMCSIMQVTETAALRHACSLGVAMQITNICRDLVADARINRIYLPLDLFPPQFNLNTHTILNETSWLELHLSAKKLLFIAEQFYRDSENGLKYLSFRNAFAILSARYIYSSIGDMIISKGPMCWRNRIYTSFTKKIYLIFKAFFKTISIKYFSNDKNVISKMPNHVLELFTFENFQNHYKKFI